MKRLVVILILLSACHGARKRAAKEGAVDKCVPDDNVALCELRDGRLFLCDEDNCIVVGDTTHLNCALPAASTIVPLKAKAEKDEQAQQQQQMMLNQ